MGNNKTDVMKAKAYIKTQYKELEIEYKNVLDDYFDERDRSDLAPKYKLDFQTLSYKIDFQMLRCTGMEIPR